MNKILKIIKKRIFKALRRLKRLDALKRFKNKKVKRFNKYFNGFKARDIKIECEKEKEEIFKKAKERDIVYANMPISKKKLSHIPEGHRCRPYYIIYKMKYGYIAYQMSSSKQSYRNLKDMNVYYLGNSTYNELKKDGYLDLFTAYYLPKNHLIKYITRLNNSDYNEISRRLWLKNKDKYETLFNSKPSLNDFIQGDLIKIDNNFWLILSIFNNNYFIVEANKYTKTSIKNTFIILSGDKPYRINTNNIKIIKNDNSIESVDVLNKNEFVKAKNLIEKNIGNLMPIPKGVIFSKNNELYYSYRTSELNISAFRLKKEVMNEDEYYVIINNDIKYFIDTSELISIEKFDDIELLLMINQKDIKSIENIYEPEQKRKRKYFTKFKIGTCFKDVYNIEYIYLYSNVINDFCIKSYEYLNPELYPEYGIHRIKIKNFENTGLINDEDLIDILKAQIFDKKDKDGILQKELNRLMNEMF